MSQSKLAFVAASILCVCALNGLMAQGHVLSQKEVDDKKRRDTWTTIGKVWSKTGAGNNDTSQRKDPPSPGKAFPRGFAGDVQNDVWTGSWVQEACTEAGGAAAVGCALQPSSGDLRLHLTRSGADLEGTTDFGDLEVALSGVQDSDGALRVSGAGRVVDSDVTITNFSGHAGEDAITGTFTLTFHPDDPTIGTVIVRAALQKMAKQP